ncbi:MAG TPA: hypothetical protein VIO43_11140 [Lutibacter sp.]
MENINTIATLFGTLITLLLSVVAYFIKQLHTDFKSVEKDLIEVKTMVLIIKTEFKSGNDLLNQKVEYIEKRVHDLELFIHKK